MTSKKVSDILNALDEAYGTEYKCYLDHDSAWQLLIATILSAQCTDARVNIVTKDLFKKYPGVEYFAKADLKELEEDIRNKVVNIKHFFFILIFPFLLRGHSVYHCSG